MIHIWRPTNTKRDQQVCADLQLNQYSFRQLPTVRAEEITQCYVFKRDNQCKFSLNLVKAEEAAEDETAAHDEEADQHLGTTWYECEMKCNPIDWCR